MLTSVRKGFLILKLNVRIHSISYYRFINVNFTNKSLVNISRKAISSVGDSLFLLVLSCFVTFLDHVKVQTNKVKHLVHETRGSLKDSVPIHTVRTSTF